MVKKVILLLTMHNIIFLNASQDAKISDLIAQKSINSEKRILDCYLPRVLQEIIAGYIRDEWIFHRCIDKYETSSGIAFTQDDKYIISGSTFIRPSTIKFAYWDINSLQIDSTFDHDAANKFLFSSDGKYLASSGPRPQKPAFARIFDISKNKIIYEFESGEPALSLSFSQNNKFVAFGYHGLIKIIDLQTLLAVKQLAIENCTIGNISFSCDGKYIAMLLRPGSPQSSIEIRNLEAEKKVTINKVNISTMSFLPDTNLLAISHGSNSYDSKKEIFDIDKMTTIGSIFAIAQIWQMKLAKNGLHGVSVSNYDADSYEATNDVEIFNRVGQQIKKFYTCPVVNDIAFSSSGKYLAIGSRNNGIEIWLNVARALLSETIMESPVVSSKLEKTTIISEPAGPIQTFWAKFF